MFGIQLYQSIHNPLPYNIWVALHQLGHQRIKAAHGAKVLGHIGALCCGGGGDYLPGLDAGAEH